MAVRGVYTHLAAGFASDAWLFSGQSNSLEVSLASNREEDTRFQATGKSYIATEPEGTIAQQGYFDDAIAGQFEKEVADAIANGETWHVAALYDTQTTACCAYVADTADISDLTVSSAAGGLITVAGTWAQGVSIRRGRRVYQGAISATGATTYIDLGAAGSNGYAYLWVYSRTGTISSGAIKVQCDDNTSFSSATDLATFTFSGLTAAKATLSGTIDRYVRLNTTSLGGATNFTVLAVVVASGVTQGVA